MMLLFFFDFPKSKCGGRCNPTNKKKPKIDLKVALAVADPAFLNGKLKWVAGHKRNFLFAKMKDFSTK